MNILDGLNPDRFYYGKLCPRGHDSNGNGQSLRLKSNRRCYQCSREDVKVDRLLEPEKHLQYRRDKYWRDPSKARQQAKDSYYRTIDGRRAYTRLNSRLYYRRNRKEILAKRRAAYWQDRAFHLGLSREYRQKYKGYLSILRAARYWADPQQSRAKARERYRKNPTPFKEGVKRWRAENRDRKNLNERRRRALKRAAQVEPYTAEQLKYRFALWDGCCAYCGVGGGLTVDHFVPLAKGGADAIGNLLPACRSCNSSKSAADAWEWYTRQQFFSQERWQKIQEVVSDASR